MNCLTKHWTHYFFSCFYHKTFIFDFLKMCFLDFQIIRYFYNRYLLNFSNFYSGCFLLVFSVHNQKHCSLIKYFNLSFFLYLTGWNKHTCCWYVEVFIWFLINFDECKNSNYSCVEVLKDVGMNNFELVFSFNSVNYSLRFIGSFKVRGWFFN